PDLTTLLNLNVYRTINQRVFCHEVQPWGSNLQIKLNGSIPLPYDMTVSGVYQNLAGPQILANYPAPNSVVALGLNRSLSGGVKSITVPILEPGTQFEDRRTQFDIRLSKIFKLTQKVRVQAHADAYNIFNLSPILSRTNT